MLTSNVRALTAFDQLPDGHAAFWMKDDANAPHINVGEFAVVDTSDRHLQHGELYLMQRDSGRRERSIVQAKIDRSVESDDDCPLWTTRELRGFRQVGKTDDGLPLFTGMIDGWYPTEWLEKRLIGRVVGVASGPLGILLEPEGGYVDEHGANAAFDERQYIDIVSAIGCEPHVCNGSDGWVYFEKMTGRRYDKYSREEELAVRWKETAASTGMDRVIAECVRRGLID